MYNVRIFRLVTALPNYGQDTHDALRVHADLSSFFTFLLQTIRKLITVALSSAIDLAVMLNSGMQARCQSGAPQQILMPPLGICKISETNTLISPLKTCHTLLHPRVAC